MRGGQNFLKQNRIQTKEGNRVIQTKEEKGMWLKRNNTVNMTTLLKLLFNADSIKILKELF